MYSIYSYLKIKIFFSEKLFQERLISKIMHNLCVFYTFMVVQSLENLEILEKSGSKILVRENLENLEKSGNFIERAKNVIGNNAFFVLKRGPVLILETSVGKMIKLP